jgi:deoxyribodipyrimidine photo-lyase
MAGLTLCWFRQDLRLADNPALYHAAKEGQILPIYILDDTHSTAYKMGGASRFWLHHSLLSLNASLDNKLRCFSGDPISILSQLCRQYPIEKVFWNRCYEPWRTKRDTEIKIQLEEKGIQVFTHNASLLWEPWEIHKEDKTPYKVFTPFYRRGCLMSAPPRIPYSVPTLNIYSDAVGGTVESLSLLPSISWDKKMQSYWQIGEEGATRCLLNFIKTGIKHYKQGRDMPSKPYVSRLSPYLHFGEISPHQVWYAVRELEEDPHVDHFCSELGWREFSYSQLYFNPQLPTQNLQSKFDNFPWKDNPEKLSAWQKGQTGIPMVDAGMRELWETGYMHNRVRMIVGSFLVKNLLIDWRYGERWFWDCLVDADLANNSASWQWVAGCGADAAPYFRIFNPVSQAEKFDPEGVYIKRYLPQLKSLPTPYLFSPWEAPASVLASANIVLGRDYPRPIVDLKRSRDQALDAFQFISQPL